MATGKILIVEDDQDIARLIGLRLKTRGYEVAVSGDAVTALSVARKENPDLILLDLGLPGGDGVIVMERLKQISSLALTPVIVISARAPEVAAERALTAGASAFVSKPIDMDELFSAIDAALAV